MAKKRRRRKKEYLDKLDIDLLAQLQKNSLKTVAELKAELKKPAATIHARIKRLQDKGIIKSHSAKVDFRKLGLRTSALIFIKLAYRKPVKELAERLKKLNQISRISIISGEYQVMANAHFKDNYALEEFLYNSKAGIKSWDIIQDLNTLLLFSEEEKGIGHISGISGVDEEKYPAGSAENEDAKHANAQSDSQ